MSTRSFLTVLVLLLICTCTLVAQDFRGTITGMVTDPSGAAVPGATVKATNTANNTTKQVQTTAAGVYTIPYLEPSTYTIEVTATGFQTLKREGIVLQVAGRVNLPLALTVGQITQEITVVGQQEVIETADANRGLVFDPVKTQQYPLNGRQTYMLLALTPGVIFTQETFGPSGFSGTRGWDVNASYRFNGARSGNNLFLLNGAQISREDGTWEVAPNVEAVQEFKVMTNTYDASYGRYRGGVVNTVTKSGGNNWHGDLFEYWRNSIFDANYFQNKAAPVDGKPKPAGLHNQHQFGGVIGGPIRKDKDFVFGSFEGWQEVIPFPALTSTVPMDLRDGQHFTQYGIKIYDPITYRVCDPKLGDVCTGSAVNGQTRSYIRDPFPDNKIPLNRISPIGQKILTYFPAPNTTGVNNGLDDNYVNASNKGRYYYEQPMVKWDHVFSDKDKFYAFYSWQQGKEWRSSSGFMGPAARGNTGDQRHDQNIILDWTRVMSTTSVLDVQASFARFVQLSPGYNDYNLTYTDLGIKTIPVAATTDWKVVPHIRLNETEDIFGNFGGATMGWHPYNHFELKPTLTMTRGRHTLRFGFDYLLYVDGQYSPGRTSGEFTFAGSKTQHYNGNPLVSRMDGSDVASLLLGVPDSGNIDYNDSKYMSKPTYSVFVQDDWKVTPKLTLNLGVRYDMQIPYRERYGRRNIGFDWSYKQPLSDQIIANWTQLKAAYDAKSPKYPYPDVPKNCCYGRIKYPDGNQRLYRTDWTNIGPRIGLAYRLGEKTVIRTGGAMFYEQNDQQGYNSGFNRSTSYITTLDGMHPSGGITGPYSLENPFPDGIMTPPQQAWTGMGGGVSMENAPFHTPRSYQYSLAIQRELPKAIQLEVAFSGNFQNHNRYTFDYNSIGLANRIKQFEDPTYTSRQVANPFYGIVTDKLLGSIATSQNIGASNLMRPDPIFYGSINDSAMQGVSYRGDTLNLKLEQRPLQGSNAGVLTWVVSYALSKGYSNNDRIYGMTDTPGDYPLLHQLDSGLKQHNFAFSGVYDLPVGAGKKFGNTNKFAKTVLGDWRFDWIFTYQSGNYIGYPSLYNYCGKWQADKQDENHWFNNDKSCYAQFPTNNIAGYAGVPRYNGPMTSIKNPTAPQLNIAFEKTITITERYKMSIRGESFNFTNTPVRNGPNTSFTNSRFGMLPADQRNWPRFCQVAAKFYF